MGPAYRSYHANERFHCLQDIVDLSTFLLLGDSKNVWKPTSGQQRRSGL